MGTSLVHAASACDKEIPHIGPVKAADTTSVGQVTTAGSDNTAVVSVDNGAAVTDWQLQVGTAVGDNSIYDSGVLGVGTLSETVTGLPTSSRSCPRRVRCSCWR